MFGIGTSELLIILVIVLLLFGAKRLPELAKGLGQSLTSFKDGLKDQERSDSKALDDEKKK